MRIILKMISVLGLLITWQSGLMAQDHTKMASDTIGYKILNVNELKWVDVPPGLPKGAMVAVLSGDPFKEGPFTIRLKFPKGYAVMPHWHPTAELITVIEGTVYMGTQETFDKQKAGKLETGGFAVLPSKSVHYAFCNDPAVIQIQGTGPFAISYNNKSDDPRNATIR